MKDGLTGALYRRELTDLAVRSRTYRSLYGNHRLIGELDIVNELDGHSGCVNALSWSKSGSLLASGSDDQHLNIHSYQPDSSTAQFRLSTTVATGHSANIFSVKFMPHSNDRTVITAAGDSEVRIFDLEYAGQSRSASTAATIASEGRRRTRTIYNDVRYLSDGDTDCRVYRSHGDRVKRIVTESSPHLFLTCSEDGEVRQWDLRQPSSFYPAPRGSRLHPAQNASLPPPLISYKRYNLDLNTISCSASQPHYIALGGAHLHAFLHDRRMTGRDRLREAGKPLPSVDGMTAQEEELMSQATQCVRKFAPTGQRKMKRTDNGHITACKISDARPNEMVVSWSGEHIYSFDLVHGPEAGEDDMASPLPKNSTGRVKESRDTKRKRKANDSETSLSHVADARGSSRQRRHASQDLQDTALRVRYQNGQSEDIPIPSLSRRTNLPLTEKQRKARSIAGRTSELRSSVFGPQREHHSEVTRYSRALSHAGDVLEQMDDVMRDWGYPLDPSEEKVLMEKTLRYKRESARRFVQASGTLARALGGKPSTPSGTAPFMAEFVSIEARRNELRPSQNEHFGYDFIKAILLWLESGIGRLIEGFSRPASMLPNVQAAQRLPIPEPEAATESIEEILIPYFLSLASDKPIANVDVNQFEVDDNIQLYASEKDAVRAFAAAVNIGFADLSSANGVADQPQGQDRQTAMRHWGHKVCRGVLLNAAEGVQHAFVNEAFGGLPSVAPELSGEQPSNSSTVPEERPIHTLEVLDSEGNMIDGATAEDAAAALRESRRTTVESDHDDSNDNDDNEEDDDDEVDDSSEVDDSDESSEPDEEDGVPNTGLPRLMYASAFERRRMKEKVEAGVPCSAYTRMYRGHCNVKTVKDVNYFGLDDEYVVSGSDDGNFFIWDQKTGELVNVLEGDGEVVNVVQAHPYETMLAVSGIDHTIKIFSPDARAREAARLGYQGISAHDTSSFSSLAWPSRIGRRRIGRRSAPSGTSDVTSEPAVPVPRAGGDEEEDEQSEEHVASNGLRSRKRMHDSYRITSQNEAERQGGNQDAFLTRSMLAQLSRRMNAYRAAMGVTAADVEEWANEERPNGAVPAADCTVQ